MSIRLVLGLIFLISEFFPSRILDPGCALKNLSILTKKNGFSARRNMIRVFDPGSGSQIWILNFYLSQIPILDPRSRIQWSKIHWIPDPGSRIRICNIADFGFAQAVGGSFGCWLSMGAAVLTTLSMDQLSEAFMCKKEFSVYFIFTLSLKFLPFLSYDALRICFLTHLVQSSILVTRKLSCHDWPQHTVWLRHVAWQVTSKNRLTCPMLTWLTILLYT